MTTYEPRAEPSQERARRTIERIEVATLEAIEKFGRDRFTTHDVAVLSGVSIGTVYRYFPDRVALLHRVAPVPANVLGALSFIGLALEALDGEPTYEPPGLRQSLLEASSLLARNDIGHGTPRIGPRRRTDYDQS